MDAHEIIVIENGVTRNPIYRLKEPINLRILEGEHIAIVGANGAGKSLLVDTIIGRYPLLMNEVPIEYYKFEPTAENLTDYFAKSIQLDLDQHFPGVVVTEVRLQETSNSIAVWTRETI